MADYDCKADAVPLTANQLDAADKVVVGDVSADGWDYLTADSFLDAIALVAASGGVLSLDGSGRLVVRFRGGTAGTQEVQVRHDGNDGKIESKSGNLLLYPGSGGYVLLGAFGTAGLQNTSTHRLGVYLGQAIRCEFSTGSVLAASGMSFGWSSAVNPAGTFPDIALARAAAKVVGLTDGVTAGATLASVALTPAQITADQNNYAPGVAWTYRLSSDASRTITGLSVSQVSGQRAKLRNVGSQNIVIAHQSASSTAANRFLLASGADVTITPNGVMNLEYDATDSRWRDG